jgi:hypothetical protein
MTMSSLEVGGADVVHRTDKKCLASQRNSACAADPGFDGKLHGPTRILEVLVLASKMEIVK